MVIVVASDTNSSYHFVNDNMSRQYKYEHARQ